MRHWKQYAKKGVAVALAVVLLPFGEFSRLLPAYAAQTDVGTENTVTENTVTEATATDVPEPEVNESGSDGSILTGDEVSVAIPEAWTLTTDKVLTENTTILSLNHTGGTLNLNGYQLTICGNYTQGNGTLKLNSGALYCNGNYSVTGYGQVIMQNANDYMYVEGDVTWNTTRNNHTLTNGILEVAGDFTELSSQRFTASGYHKVLMSGSAAQTITLGQYSYFQILELQNYSEAGVGTTSLINYQEFIGNGCKFSMGEGNTVVGYTLEEDVCIEGDTGLSAGVLDLNGHTLTVKGDFVHAGGELVIGNGKLVIEGDYRSQIKTGNSYTNGNGCLKMTDHDGYMLVKGGYYTKSNRNHSNCLTAGTLEIQGDFYTYTDTGSNGSYYNFYATGTHKVLLSGEGE